MDKRLFACALVMLALYAPTLGYDYVYEDKNDLETFTQPWPLRGWEDTWHRVTHMPQRIGRDLSFAIAGTDPMSAHAGNVVLHLVNGVLVYRLGLLWITPAGAVVAAGLFWLHPVQVESVAYISSRSDVLATTFALLAVLLWRRAWWSLACALACVFTKETYAAVLVVPLLDGTTTRPTIPLWVWSALAIPIVAYGLWTFGRWPHPYPAMLTLTQLTSLLSLWVLPIGQTIDHDWVRISAPMVIVTVVLWSQLAVIAAWWQWPAWSLALGSIVLLFVPRFVIPLAEGLHEHHLYLPAVALSLWCGTFVKGPSCVAMSSPLSSDPY